MVAKYLHFTMRFSKVVVRREGRAGGLAEAVRAEEFR